MTGSVPGATLTCLSIHASNMCTCANHNEEEDETLLARALFFATYISRL